MANIIGEYCCRYNAASHVVVYQYTTRYRIVAGSAYQYCAADNMVTTGDVRTSHHAGF